MSIKIATPQQLYLYQLLVKSFGIGTQAFLPRVEEVLAEDGMSPEDLGCADVRTLMEALSFASLTTFKGGRAYVTLQARSDFDEALATLAEGEASQAAGTGKGGKPWKRKKSALKPQRPQARRAKEAKRGEKDDAAAARAAQASVAEAEPTPEPAPEPAPEPEPAFEPEPEPEPVARTLAEILAEARAEEARLKAEEEARRTAEEEAAAMAQEESTAAEEEAVAPALTPAPATPAAAPAAAPAPAARPTLPDDFWDEVHCPNELLSALTRILPFGADLTATLADDWQVARSTGTLEATRSEATFPLHYLHRDGTPLQVTIARRARAGLGRRWELTAVDGDATGEAHEAAGLEGARLADEGAWAQLSAADLAAYRRVSPLRELSRLVAVGSLDEVARQAAELAVPEDWGAGLATLREYLCVTFFAVQRQDLVQVAPDGSLAAWNTGLFTPDYQDLLCLLAPDGSSTPWAFAGFAAPGDPRLAPLGGALPARASYLASLDEARLAPGAHVSPAPRLDVTPEALERAVRHGKASWRDCAPVWDPQDQRAKLLLPLAVTAGQAPTRALLVSPQDQASGEKDAAAPSYLAAKTLPLARARVCARLVSPTLPGWLCGEDQ